MNKKSTRAFVMTLTGGVIYFYFEILVRGYSHVSMFFLGGVCFYIVGYYGTRVLDLKIKLTSQLLVIMVISSAVITVLELITGLLVNVYLKLGVWDYSQMSYNFMGQICLLYSILWAILGLPCVYFYGILNRFVFDEKIGVKSEVYTE